MHSLLTTSVLMLVMIFSKCVAADEVADPLAGKTFQLLAKHTGGRGGGFVFWQISFKDSKFEWVYADCVQAGKYEFDSRINQVIGRAGSDEFRGLFDPKSGILVWNTLKYQVKR